MTIPALLAVRDQIALVPRLKLLAAGIAVRRALAVEEAQARIADAIEAAGLTIGEAARRGSKLVEAVRTAHDILPPAYERSPWLMAYEEFQRAGFAIRRGEIEPTGAYFSTPGESTYHDAETEDPTVTRYDLSGLMIADTRDQAVALAILRESLHERDHTDEDRARVLDLISEVEAGEFSISYMDCDGLVLSRAAQRLGWDGILVWENDDITTPSSVFVWAVERVDRVAVNHRQAVLEAVQEGLPVPECIHREALQNQSEDHIRDLDARVVNAIKDRFGIPVEAVASLLGDDVEKLRDRDRFSAVPNMMDPQNFPRHPEGTAKILHWPTNPAEAYVSYLRAFPATALGTSEPEDNIRKHPTFLRYVEMLQQGYEAPYIHVFETNGKLTSSNRRRTLAAQVVDGLICGWLGVDNPETGVPLKYGDVLSAYEEELVKLATAQPDPQGPGIESAVVSQQPDISPC
ncbi:hypothetical protein [Ralstonia sp. ASV6]|uniref:hypothetical protein n=1 Tax=Ralstonia sp. ASV6 TaxID=2795124 RepID=UPI0018EA6A38|nr:hypothetical protein [Ralstonia sp. ASV6]